MVWLNTHAEHTHVHTHTATVSGSVVHLSIKQPRHLSVRKTNSVCNQAQTAAACRMAEGCSVLLQGPACMWASRVSLHKLLSTQLWHKLKGEIYRLSNDKTQREMEPIVMIMRF